MHAYAHLKKLTEAQDLAQFLEITEEEAQDLIDNEEWLVLDDENADNWTAESIKDSLWAFNADFLGGATGLGPEPFTAIQANNRCESNNDAIEALIKGTCGLEHVVKEAILADGRGHFLAHYDHEEIELKQHYGYRRN